ncbi:hypothetical protein AC28_4462 [Escherichia coli 1-250-04_S3_C2]|nr:hypothetical protein AC28_4462 [Escherichia coli 1-250-04_S3_C2]
MLIAKKQSNFTGFFAIDEWLRFRCKLPTSFDNQRRYDTAGYLSTCRAY